jgi:hypothetical protein
LLGLLYGAQGVTQTAQQSMASVWDVPQLERTGFLPRLGRSFAGLVIIGGAFLINAVITGYAVRPGESYVLRVPVLAGLLILNVALYWASFDVLTPKEIEKRALLPGAILGGTAFTVLLTLGTGLITHQLKNASNTYGTFGSVIGIVTFLLLLAKLSLYAAELNPVLHRKLYPRALPMGEMTDADRQVHRALIHEQQRSPEEHRGRLPTRPGRAGRGRRRTDHHTRDVAAGLRPGGPATTAVLWPASTPRDERPSNGRVRVKALPDASAPRCLVGLTAHMTWSMETMEIGGGSCGPAWEQMMVDA